MWVVWNGTTIGGHFEHDSRNTLCNSRVFSLTSFWRIAMVPIQIRETMVVLPDPVGSGIRKQPSASLGSQRLQTTSRDCRASGVGASASGFEGDSHPSVRVAFFGF